MRLNKHPESEKRLCKDQEVMILNHTRICRICEKSFDEYNKCGISNTPPCKQFIDNLRVHIDNCSTCNMANKKWNDDAIPTIPEMRQVSSMISKGQLPNAVLLNKVRSYLMEKLELSSLEINQLSSTIDGIVRGKIK